MTDKRDDELTADDRHSRLDQQHDMPPRPIAPPPLVSPQPPKPAPGDSDIRPLTKRELRAIKEAEKKAADSEAKAKRIKNFIWATVGIVLSTVTITVSTVGFAQSAIDGGASKAVAPVEQRVGKVEQRLDKMESVQQQAALEQVRTNVMLENLSRDRGLPVPPPTPKFTSDAGQ